MESQHCPNTNWAQAFTANHFKRMNSLHSLKTTLQRLCKCVNTLKDTGKGILRLSHRGTALQRLKKTQKALKYSLEDSMNSKWPKISNARSKSTWSNVKRSWKAWDYSKLPMPPSPHWRETIIDGNACFDLKSAVTGHLEMKIND